jgi:hypothetical protein
VAAFHLFEMPLLFSFTLLEFPKAAFRDAKVAFQRHETPL